MAKKRIALYFGSFNPIHKGHTALAEYVVEQGLCDELVMIVSPQNPFKEVWMQASELDRFAMAEIACRNTLHAERIKPSAIEFLLDKPSYTINTLDYLTESHGCDMDFTLLMGSDLINQLPQWKDAERIIAQYDILVYPRPDVEMSFSTARTTLLKDAPQYNISSTEIRRRLECNEDAAELLDAEVLQYIRQHGLWTTASKIAALTAAIEQSSSRAELYIERGKCYFRHDEWGNAINDFRRAEQLEPENGEARQYIDMVQEILEFRYKDIYNP